MSSLQTGKRYNPLVSKLHTPTPPFWIHGFLIQKKKTHKSKNQIRDTKVYADAETNRRHKWSSGDGPTTFSHFIIIILFFHNNNELFTNSKKVQSVDIETAYTNSPSTSHAQKLMTTVTMSWNKIHQNKFNMDQQFIPQHVTTSGMKQWGWLFLHLILFKYIFYEDSIIWQRQYHQTKTVPSDEDNTIRETPSHPSGEVAAI